jgi:excisionase family DNA binding protein
MSVRVGSPSEDDWQYWLRRIVESISRLSDAIERYESPEMLTQILQKAFMSLASHGTFDRESYSTDEAAQLLDRSRYTIREACRLGRIKATRAKDRRGGVGEWRIAREEIRRILDDGLPPAVAR